ncbi:hypothetical protein ABIE45_006374 [Methylobacterium sp. OAE515]
MVAAMGTHLRSALEIIPGPLSQPMTGGAEVLLIAEATRPHPAPPRTYCSPSPLVWILAAYEGRADVCLIDPNEGLRLHCA